MKRLSVLLLLSLIAACHHAVAGWSWAAPRPAYVGMPAARGELVAATYGHSYLVVVRTGQLLWQARLVGVRDVAPTFRGREVLAATDTGVAAFAGGRVLWQRDIGDRASTPVLVGDAIVFTTWEGRVVMLDGWSVDLPGPSLGPPAVGAGVVVASWEGGVVGLDAATGHVRWQHEYDGADTSAPAIFGDVAVVVGGDRRAHAIDLHSGRESWSVRMNGAGSPEAPPSVSGGRVAAVDRLGHLAVIDHAGNARWTADAHSAVVRGGPVWLRDAIAVPIDDGRVMVATAQKRTFHDPPGRVSGLAPTRNQLIVATREAPTNELSAITAR